MARVPDSCPAGWGANYVVVSGDTMWRIAINHGVDLSDLIAANPHITDPHWIFPGDVLCVPIPDIPGYFIVTDWSEYQDEPNTRWWRGYTFQVTMPIVVRALVAGTHAYSSAYRAYAGLYVGSHNGVMTSLLASKEIPGLGRGQILEIPPVTLTPGVWYGLAAGTTGSGGTYISNVERWDTQQMVWGEVFLHDWRPETDDGIQTFHWAIHGQPEDILNQTAYTTETGPFSGSAVDARPELGFISTGGNFLTIGWVREGGIWKPLVSTPENPWDVPKPTIE